MRITELQTNEKYSRKGWESDYYYIIHESEIGVFRDNDGDDYIFSYIDIQADDWYLIEEEEDKDRLKEAVILIKKLLNVASTRSPPLSKFQEEDFKRAVKFIDKCEVKNENN